tara:strand:+ start:1160 stop:1513 length:354 start_codon:yes stop_codon:yes gene_type:complete
MNIGTSLYTWFFGNFVGEDKYKNKYFCNSKDFLDMNAKRWVIFKGEIEASKVPSHWHAWLHKTIKSPPLDYKHKYSWQKDHEKNMTGTDKAYYPDSHPLSKSNKAELTKGEYEKWNP